ncbi:MAG: UDP-N-acetyl glucosamine 2-epimerase, partial [Campylobacterales bacterium]|nr:UDP-N-acetyl glucosamine 2-epimerase [Campylobacterales bacterium]
GIQEETTYLQIPCITFRDNTERPVTVWEGTNTLAKVKEMDRLSEEILNKNYKKGKIPLLWDGKTAVRVVDEIKSLF